MPAKCVEALAAALLAAVAVGRGGTNGRAAAPPAAAPGAASATTASAKPRATFVAPNGESGSLEIAATDAEREKGLMGRAGVPRGEGMVFVFDAPGEHSFWMLHCLTPLDLVWLDQAGTVVHLVEAAPICEAEPCPYYSSGASAAMVVEFGPGEARRMGIVPGATLRVALPAAK